MYRDASRSCIVDYPPAYLAVLFVAFRPSRLSLPSSLFLPKATSAPPSVPRLSQPISWLSPGAIYTHGSSPRVYTFPFLSLSLSVGQHAASSSLPIFISPYTRVSLSPFHLSIISPRLLDCPRSREPAHIVFSSLHPNLGTDRGAFRGEPPLGIVCARCRAPLHSGVCHQLRLTSFSAFAPSFLSPSHTRSAILSLSLSLSLAFYCSFSIFLFLVAEPSFPSPGSIFLSSLSSLLRVSPTSTSPSPRSSRAYPHHAM